MGCCVDKTISVDDAPTLFVACRDNTIDIITLMTTDILTRESLEYRDENGNTAFMWACKNQNETIAITLLDTESVRPQLVDREGNNALMLACLNNLGCVVMNILLGYQINLLQQNNEGMNAIMIACFRGMSKIMNHLIIACPASINQITNDGNNALMIACLAKQDDIANKLVKLKTTNILQVNRQGEDAFSIACGWELHHTIIGIMERKEFSKTCVVDGINKLVECNNLDLLRIFVKMYEQPVNEYKLKDQAIRLAIRIKN